MPVRVVAPERDLLWTARRISARGGYDLARHPPPQRPGPDRIPTEQELREDLAAAYRLIALFGMTDLVFTHLSLRLPGEGHRFLVNPYGMLFEEITASSL